MKSTSVDPSTPTEQQKASVHWPSVWQFGLSLFAILALWGISFVMLISVLDAAIAGNTIGMLSILLNIAGTAFAGVLLIPSIGYAVFRLLNKPAPFRFHLHRPGWIILALPPVLLLGQWSLNAGLGKYLFLPLMHVLATGISVSWLLTLGLRSLSAGSPQISWGIFGSGLVGAPFLSLIAEFAFLLLVGLMIMLFLMQDPQAAQIIMELSRNMRLESPEMAFELLEPYLMRPTTVYISLLFGALLVPLIEELFKPIGVWLLIRHKPNPAQGFAAGLLSGAGYALFENFVLGAAASEDWAMVVIARMGTSLIHIVTTGLTGWALASAWSQKRYLRLVGAYLAAVSLHAAWNGTVILTAITDLLPAEITMPALLTGIGAAAPVVFVILILICLVLLLGFNIVLRRAIIPPAQPQIVVEVQPEKEIVDNGNYHLSD